MPERYEIRWCNPDYPRYFYTEERKYRTFHFAKKHADRLLLMGMYADVFRGGEIVRHR